ncbi:hypothetical protein CPB83DRAFT_878646 [Crepidotus variabilis]|uniref:Uncharacterized protein n=1 Tax=Crepidotus variabilis TaxID=179855 RepID=A0A9P6JWT8_9AGAR|nr:hypothetical protein CPB83DRAFT_878646 [Crepidotus variabilis]
MAGRLHCTLKLQHSKLNKRTLNNTSSIMSIYSIGAYSGGTAFVGLGSILPPFQLSIGVPTLQQASITSVAIGTGFGIYAIYAGFFDGTVRVPKKIAQAQGYNATAFDFEAYEDVGVHWMNLPAGYFPQDIPAHVDDGNASVLLSALDSGYGECPFEEGVVSVKWMDYPAGYFPLNVPTFVDNGHESVLQSPLHPEPTVCAVDEAPVPVKWLEYTSEFVLSNMDLLVDDEIPFGYPTNMICSLDSEKIERAFFTLRNPPTRIHIHSTPVRSVVDTRLGSVHLFLALIITFTILGAAFITFETRYSNLVSAVLDDSDEPPIQQLDEQTIEPPKKKASEAALYKLGATPASRIGGSRHRNKKPKKISKSTKSTNTNDINDIEKHSFSVAPVLESLS